MAQKSISCGVSQMPVVGLGTWQSKKGEVGAAVEHALRNGYRHIDCAMIYQNEEEIGETFKKVFSEGIVKREDVFITSKLWCTYKRAEDVLKACTKTLKDLQLEYLDLYLIHWPFSLRPGNTFFPSKSDGENPYDGNNPSFKETWNALEKLVDQGKVKNIGLSNFNKDQIEEVLEFARVKPASLQVESHPFFPNHDLLAFCKKNNIAFVSYRPLGNPGNLSKNPELKNLLEDENVKEIAVKHNKSPGQILIRYQIEKGNAVIPKSVNASRIKENVNVFDFNLDASDMASLNSVYKKVVTMAQKSISCGVSQMPVVGLGTWQSKKGEVGAAVEHALRNGYRHIDCAMVYQNEEEIGETFKKVFSEGVVKREDVFITSKLWNTYKRAEDVPKACAKTLKDLQLDYLDLYLIHWPVMFKPGENLFPTDADGKFIYDEQNPSFKETWNALEKLVDEGKVKNIGLSNFNKDQIAEVLEFARVKPASLQVESHPQLPNLELLDICKKNDIAFVAYSPLGNPGSVFRRPEQKNLLEDDDVKKIAAKHKKSAGQILIRYQIDKGNVVIPKSVTPSRIDENLDVFGFSLDETDMGVLNNLYKKIGPKGFRTCAVAHWGTHPNYPFKDEL